MLPHDPAVPLLSEFTEDWKQDLVEIFFFFIFIFIFLVEILYPCSEEHYSQMPR